MPECKQRQVAVAGKFALTLYGMPRKSWAKALPRACCCCTHLTSQAEAEAPGSAGEETQHGFCSWAESTCCARQLKPVCQPDLVLVVPAAIKASSNQLSADLKQFFASLNLQEANIGGANPGDWYGYCSTSWYYLQVNTWDMGRHFKGHQIIT